MYHGAGGESIELQIADCRVQSAANLQSAICNQTWVGLRRLPCRAILDLPAPGSPAAG
ncbi:hypothetical protein K2Z83_17345 [Oscillochloris sp. ZM17-4]|uniref:hypothetical protein n=1 Tax=Oscillochloris sp. ZM17-4 TaxID=2866714 RepID=UPI001C735E42|nr:hypothetical protein [Oscillochloris sp. ZM17-4]MBX0329439.1 hypothetical protein [Oscillochloris sp. ZM17-4]